MNKASVSKKALSVLLSVLMMLTCCVPAFPWLSEKVGSLLALTADAAVGNVTQAHATAFSNALATYSSMLSTGNGDQQQNAKFHVAEALRDVVNDLAYKPTSFSYPHVGYQGSATSGDYTHDITWGDRTAPFMSDIRTAALAYCTDNNQRALVNSLIPTAANETDTPQNQKYHIDHGSSTSNVWPNQDSWEDYITLSAIASPTASVERTVKQAMYDYSLNTIGNMPNNVNTKITIKYNVGLWTMGDRKTNVGGSRSDVVEYYYFETDSNGDCVTKTYATSSASTLRSDVTTLLNRFNKTRVEQDPFIAFANTAQAQTEVDDNNTAYNNFWTNSGRWSKGDNNDILLMDYFGNQYITDDPHQFTTIAGESHSAVGYTNAVGIYMDACVDALNYYTCKPYAENIGQYSLSTGANALDRDRLYFYRNPATNEIEKAFDLDYMTKLQAQTIWTSIRSDLDFIEVIYGNVDGNVTDNTATKGLKKLYSVDGYYHTDVVNLLTLLEDYYEYYDLVQLKQTIDNYITDYQIPTADNVNLLAPGSSYKFRDNDPESATYVSDAQIDVLYGLFRGYVTTLSSDDTYSRKLKFYVFGNANFDEDPDIAYIETVRDYLSYEAERRGFVLELAPFVAHFTPLIYMNLGSLTLNQLQNHVLEDQAIYEKVYAYTFLDGQGNQMVDTNNGNAPITPEYLGYTESYPYNYINVYNKYYNSHNTTDPYSFNSNPLARADFLDLLGTFNEDVQYYIYRLYTQLAFVLTNRVRDAMNATNDADPNLVITLNNFALIKAAVERVTKSFTTLADATYDENENQTGVYLFDYLKNSSYMWKQSHKDDAGYYDDAFVNTKLDLVDDITLTTDLGNTYSLQTAYNMIMNGTFVQKYNDFVATGGLNDWQQLHYYNTSDGNATQGYKFTKPEAYMVRLPYAGDLGRGNNTIANDTYTVNNKMVDNLVNQLDSFLCSNDMTAILSSFIKVEDDSSMITDMPLNEYVMYLLGEKLFTDKILNTVVNLIFPLITGKLEGLWNDLDGMVIDPDKGAIVGKGHLNTTRSIYSIAAALGLSVYPQKIAELIPTSDTQLASARAALIDTSIRDSNEYYRGNDWTNLRNRHPYVDPATGEPDAEALGLDWGIDSVTLQEGETTLHWFNRRATNFKHALSTVLSGLETLLLCIMTDYNYAQPEEVDRAIRVKGDSGLFGAVNVNPGLKDIHIDGVQGFPRIVTPILEALGCSASDILTKDQVNAIKNQTYGKTESLVNAIFNPIISLVTNQVAAAPLGTILTLLPNLFYFLAFNTIDTLLGDLTLKIYGAKADLPVIGSWSISIRASWLLEVINPSIDGISWECPGKVAGLFSDPNNIFVNVYGLIGGNINSLIKAVDISDINDIVAVILKAVLKDKGDLEMPSVDVGSVLARTTLYETAQTHGRPYIATKAIKSNGSAYDRRYFVADKADMFYEIISWVAKAFQNGSFIEQLVAIITGSNQTQDTLVDELLLGVKYAGPAHFVMGLVEVFQPKARAGVSSTSIWANTTYMPAQYTWYGKDSAQNGMANKPITSFLYVAYQNDWTYVKANTFVENADTIITKLLENQLKEREVNSFGEWLLSLINLAWSNEAVTTVMRLLVTLGNATKNELIDYIIGRFTANGMDLGEWYDAFGYLFPDIVMEEVDSGEVDENNEPIMVKQMPERLDPSSPNYSNVFGNLSVAVDPEYEEDLNESGVDRNRNKKYIWSYNGTALTLGDRQTFQDILGYMLAGGSGTKGGMMPAIDIFLSGDPGELFKQLNGTTLLTIRGSNGYDSAIVPFFEALGMNELLTADDFKGFAESVGLNASTDFATGRHMLKQSEFDSIASEQLKVEYLFNVAFGFLEKITKPEYTEKLDDEGHVVLDEVTGEPVMVPVYNKLVKDILTTVLPTGLYFLQSNGLSVMVRNLLQPVLTLVDAILPMFNINKELAKDNHTDETGPNGVPDGIDDITKEVLVEGTPLDDLLNELVGRFVLPLLGKSGDRQIKKDGDNFLYETDTNGEPKRDSDGNVIYIYDDDYGVSLKDLSLHAIAGLVEKLLGLNMEPFVYGLDAICSTVVSRDSFVNSASESSTDAFWTTEGARNTFKKPVFLNGAYYNIIAGENGLPPTTSGDPQNVNDPANVATILVSLVLDLVLEEQSKSPKRTMVTDGEGKPVYIVDQNGNTTTMVQYTEEGGYYTNAEAVVNVIKVFTDAELVDLIPMVINAVRELGFTTAWTITPNWSYFDDIDRADYDPETGEIIRTNRRTTAQLIAEAQAMELNTGYAMINTPVRTIYYLRYAENFAPKQNLWSRELATYLDTSLSDLADWIIADFVAKDENATLGSYLENLLTGEGGLIKKGIINTINAALRDGIGGAVAKFSELLNIFLSFDVNFWNDDPYPEAEADDPLTLTQFGQDLARLFTPLNEVLTWLLAGNDIAMFHSYRTTGGYTEWVMDANDRPEDYGDIKDLIKLPGGQGYWVALVPLLEMLGIELPKNADNTGYKYLRESEGANAGRIYYMNGDVKQYADGIEILTDVIVAVLSQVEGWLRGEDPLGLGDNVIDCVLNRLANVFYFLNANGLVSVVVNLLSPLVPLANAIVPLIFSDLGVPEQGEDEEDAAYETRKFIVLVDELLDELLYTEKTITQLNPDTGLEEEVTERTPLLPESFSIVDLNLYNIFEVIKDITGLDINGAVTSTFYVNGVDDSDGTVEYNYLQYFFLGEISMRLSANGDYYFRMDFNDEESRADFITILIYTLMDVVNNAITPGTSNNEFFVNILGKTDEEDEHGNAIIDRELGQQKLTDLYNIIHAKVEGYEGYDWFYFDKNAREAYYARTPETEYSATLQLKIQSILEALAGGGYQVDWNDTTMEYLLTGYLNYNDTNLWDEGTARMVEARFQEIVELAVNALLGEGVTLGDYLRDTLEGLNLYSNQYIVMLGALLGNLLSGIPENVTELLSAAVPGFDATYWNRYAGKAVEDAEHPAGTIEYDEETGEPVKEYVALEIYTSKEEFVNEFITLFEPFGYLLDWLLVGEHKGLELFYVVDGEANDTPAISIGGANGFKEGLVPLLEALGLRFSAAEVNDPDLTGIDCIRITLLSLLNWVDDLLAADDLVGAVVDLLPNIIYFINANGLTVTVLNTLRSLTNILELASGIISTGDNDITNLNTLLGLDKKGINLYDLSLEGICNIVKGFTGLDIIKAVSIPEPYEAVVTDDEGNPVIDEETGDPVTETRYRYNSYLQQWAIGKVTTNTESALYPERNMYRMDFTYTPAEIAAFGADWSGISVEERARRMERINIFTILVCSVIDVFKLEDNEETLRGWLGDYYDIINEILNLTAGEIHYDPFDWFYFSEDIYGSVLAAEESEEYGNWATYFPEDGSEVVVKYLDTTPYSLIYKYGYFEYYRHEAGDTGNLWNKNSVGYLKDNFYNLIDTVVKLVTKYDETTGTGFATAGAFIADAWNGLNLYSTKNLYSVGYAVGNLLANFKDVLELALSILLGVEIDANWDEYMLHRVTDDETLVGTPVKNEDNTVVTYKGTTVTYIANASMDRTAFINAIVDIFSPADFLISWFLVGADTPLEFMYTKYGEAAISLNGGNGYDEALVPILEALGCNPQASYFTDGGGTVEKTGINVVKYVADLLLGRVDAIAASANPVQEIVAMLPELIYFINANGLSVAVRNLIAPVVNLLGLVNNFVDTGDVGEIETVDDLLAFALNMLKDKVNVDFDLTQITISDLSITGVFNLLKTVLGIDINAAMTFPQMTNDEHGNTVPVEPTKLINIWETLALGKVTRFTSANGRTAFRMDACSDEAALSQIDMIAILMATVVNVFEAKEEDGVTYTNRAAIVKLIGEKGNDVYDAILNILNLEDGKYFDYDWLFTLRTPDKHLPYLDPNYQNKYVSPIDGVSAITGTAGYDRYWTKEMAQYVADNLVKVVNNVLLLIGISIPGIDGPIESIDDLINGLIPGGSLYTNELLAKLTGLIAGTGEISEDGVPDAGLMAKLDEIDPDGAIQGLLKDLLGIDLDLVRAYQGRTEFGFTDGDRNGFVRALAQFLRPVNPLLEWLFTDKSISLFYNYDASDLIKLPGGNGYEQAIIPLFEAVIGYDNPNIKTLAEYKADIIADPDNMLIDILNPLLDFVDAALADPLNVILGRIPAIVYFINSKAADRMVKNLLSPVYQVLNALNTLVDIDIDSLIEGAIGFTLEELDFNAIIEVVIGLLPDNLSSLSPLIVDAVKEFTIGKVIQYPSHATFHTDLNAAYQYGFTMELDSASSSSSGGTSFGSQNATLADLITILLRAVIKWLTMPENQETVVTFLNNNIENEQVRTYVLNAYGVDETTLGAIDTGLIGFRYQPYGVSMMMALLYYVYFAVNLTSSEAITAVQKYGNYWPYVSGALDSVTALNSNLAFLGTFTNYMDGLVARVNAQNNTGSGDNGNTGYVPETEDTDGHGNGQTITDVVNDLNNSDSPKLNFFQRIIKWFQDLFARIAALFSR
ncbi:MAG: hypothetical protein IK108_01540 [Clostridia bacterium]|nr:hypothetical protein [Clostridia bacterium]